MIALFLIVLKNIRIHEKLILEEVAMMREKSAKNIEQILKVFEQVRMHEDCYVRAINIIL